MEKLTFLAEVRTKMSNLISYKSQHKIQPAKNDCEDVWFHSAISEKAYP
jgi:hypothetical protein